LFYKVGKKLFDIVINLLHAVQVVLIFLSFFVILYWILDITGVKFIAPVAPFFEAIKSITHIFYNRMSDVGGTKIDFSFLMATCAMLILTWALKVIIDYIKEIEKGYDKTYRYIKTKKEDLFNKQLEQERIVEESKNNQFIILIRFNTINNKKDRLFDRNINEGIAAKSNEVLLDFFELLEEDFDCDKKILEDGILLHFKNFNNVDRIISTFMSGINALKKKFADENWEVNFIMTIDVMADESEIQAKTENLISLNELGMANEMLCFGTLKERYALLKQPKYYMHEKGTYQINGDDKNVFCIKSLK